MSGINWLTELFPPDDDDTQVDEPLVHASGAVPVVVIFTPEGRKLGEVMRDSIVHRMLLENGFYEVDVQS